MYKKATFVLMSIGALLLVGNSASAKITKAESYVTIKSSTEDDYTLRFNATTLNNVSNASLYTETSLYAGGKVVDGAEGGAKASGTYTEIHGPQITYKLLTDHTESVKGNRTDYKQTDDFVTYKPSDWSFASQEEDEVVKVESAEQAQAAKAFENILIQQANEISQDTGIDLSEYSLIDKQKVFEMDSGLFDEVHELTRASSLQVGDSMPQIHLHESGKSLYVLRQYADGTSKAIEFVLENGKWEKQ
ncbi:hypothetical protein [Brevibacillus sp. MER 51]|uniref:hypothetical protein n=1 Tax=Brevibacillus sp. MER 51 TaxID=2939560 RepID=UPI00203A733E|nr:hypothetical protein [Brevibacillus sp. MER 51]MCM3143885.1 hypothetical protein [Brevibacillus sp. MER 51]